MYITYLKIFFIKNTSAITSAIPDAIFIPVCFAVINAINCVVAFVLYNNPVTIPSAIAPFP